MTNEKLIAEKLLQINAIQLRPANPFTWASGLKSPIYCDNRRVLSFPYQRDFIKSEMCSIVFESYPEANIICGVATAGISWGAMTADQLKMPFIYCRPEPKKHGLGNQIEGYFTEGQKVVVIEDLISTGKSSLQVVDVLRKSGLQVIGMVAIFSYGFEEAKLKFKENDLPLKTLTNYPSLLEMAIEKKIIEPGLQEVLLKWRSNPRDWQAI
jgi:orotate phosphoribosyltransferase